MIFRIIFYTFAAIGGIYFSLTVSKQMYIIGTSFGAGFLLCLLLVAIYNKFLVDDEDEPTEEVKYEK